MAQVPVAPKNLRLTQLIVPVNPTRSVAWTRQAETSGWPGFDGYLELTYDPLSRRTLYYGTVDGSVSIYASDAFAYNSSTNVWTRIGGNGHLVNNCTETGASWPLDRHPYGQMAVDTTRNRLWLWSGVCSGTNRQDLWYLSLNTDPATNTWTSLSPATLPTPGNSAAMVYDPDDDVLFLFGSDTGAQTHDHWVYCPTSTTLSAAQTAAGCVSANDWAEVSIVGGSSPGTTMPSGPVYPRLMYDTVHRRVIQYGGESGGLVAQNETWSYAIPTKTWTKKCGGGCNPPPVYTTSPSTAAMVFLPRSGTFLYHQVVNTGAPRDWLYDPTADTWTVLTSTGAGPTVDTLAAYDTATGTVILFHKDPATSRLAIWQGALRGL